LLWRAVVIDEAGYYEAYCSVFDSDGQIRFRHYTSQHELLNGIEDYWPVKRLQWFSRGFYSVSLRQTDIVISDLRMGVEPNYAFQFKVGELSNPHAKPVPPQQITSIRDLSILRPMWRRIWDQAVNL
jgi:inner membrane protein